MTIWVANWFRPKEGFTPADIAERALEMVPFVAAPAGRRASRRR